MTLVSRGARSASIVGMSAHRRVLPLGVLLALVLAAPAAAEFDTVLVSRSGLAGPAGDDQSYRKPSISGDGRYIAFFTLAGNFPGGLKGSSRAYRKDTVTGDVVLISRADGPDGAPLGGNDPEISRDGRWACFGGGTAARDIEGGRTYRLPAPPAGLPPVPAAPAGANSAAADDLTYSSCAISDDGTRVALMTPGRFVVEDTDGGIEDIYVWDVPTGTMTLVSRADGPAGADADAPAFGPSMTRDGRSVAFWTRATNLSGEDPDPVADVFVRDLQAGTTTWVSRPGAGATGGLSAGGYGSYDPAISDDGRKIAFSSWTRLDPAVAFGATKWVFRRDLAAGTTVLVSRASGTRGRPADAQSENPSVSPDGRFVAFESFAGNLDLDSLDGLGNSDVFIRDVQARRTTLVSRASGVFGAASDGYSFGAALAANNARVAFVSRGENLSPDDVALGDAYYRDTVGTLGLLPADIPGAPKILGVKTTSAVLARASSAAAAADRPARITFTLSEFTRMTVAVDRRSAGRWRRVGSLAVVGTEGRNVVRVRRTTFTRRLREGTYRARITVRDFNAQRAARTVTFKVRRGR